MQKLFTASDAKRSWRLRHSCQHFTGEGEIYFDVSLTLTFDDNFCQSTFFPLLMAIIHLYGWCDARRLRWRRYVSSGKIAFDYTANKWCRETICLIHVMVLRHIWETPSCMWYHNSVAKHNLNTTWGESLNGERVRMRESSSPIPSAEIKFYSVCSVRSVHFIHAYSLGMQKNFRTLIWSWRAKASESVESADLYIHSQTLMCNSLSLCVVSCGYRFYYAAHISGSFELQERLTNKFYLRI